MLKVFAGGILCLVLLTSNVAAQSCISYPNPLTNGTTANGSDVIGDMLYMSGCLAPLANPSFTGIGAINTATASAAYDTMNMQNYGQFSVGNYANNLSSVAGIVLTQFNAGGAITAGYNGTGEGFLAFGAANGITGSGGPQMFEYVRIVHGGDVGIDTSSPSYTLHVNGSVAGVGAYNQLSDERLKKDVRPITDALSLIERLSGVRFEWKSAAERTVGKSANLPVGKAQIGFIAQDVEKVLPEAVTTAKGSEAIKSVAESKIVPVLVEALKELKAANDNQAAEIRTLETRVSKLEREHGTRTAQR